MTGKRIAADGSEMAHRAALSDGLSHVAIHAAVMRALDRGPVGACVVDVGCGRGSFRAALGERAGRYVGVDGVASPGRPVDADFLVLADLDKGVPLRDSCGDVVVAIETVEHLENPRAFLRELARIVRPGGTVVVTTPNQLSALSMLTLVLRQRFDAFRDVHYPAHRTALLPVDLQRIAGEVGLVEASIQYSCAGRMPFTSRHYPRVLARLAPRFCSDSVLLRARSPRS